MRDLWPQLGAWIDSSEPFALATVTHVAGSAPRAPGACMALMPDQSRFLGSVSSGCLDVEIVEAARAALADGRSRRLSFGPDGQPPWSDGLSCGGQIHVRLDPWWGCSGAEQQRTVAEMVGAWLAHGQFGVLLSRDDHHCAVDLAGARAGDLDAFDGELIERALQHLRAERPPVEWDSNDGPVFVRTLLPRPRLILVGAVDVAAAMVSIARVAGFQTVVIDPRRAFSIAERFSDTPDAFYSSWPQNVIQSLALSWRDVAVTVTHDPKIDDVALLALLRTSCGYVGALGSKRSHQARLERLRREGATEETLQRIHGPAGIHLGTPHASGIAIGIMAGIAQWQATQEQAARAASMQATAVESTLALRRQPVG